MRSAVVGVLCVASVLRCSPVCFAADDPRADATTGRDTANYPPPRHFDHIHMSLSIDIPDMSKPFLTGVETLTVTPIGKAREELVLNATGPKVESVSLAGKAALSRKPLSFTQDERFVRVRFDPPVKLGEMVEVVLKYTVDSPRPDGSGLTWTKGRANAASETDQFAQIHSQGQPEHNRQWYPCHDFPNERLTTELYVTVEDPYVVCCNGKLEGTTLGPPSETGKPRMIWHWVQDKPHANYLVSMVVGRFSIVGLSAANAEEDRVRCWLYAPVGKEKSAAAVYAKTPAMVATFSRLFGEPYPWDKYTQALVRNFAAGGMENTSATTMRAGSATSSADAEEDVISHELAHQWFGDLMTNKSWEHAWLNEGWASFAEALWKESEEGDEEKARRAYQSMIVGFVRGQGARNNTIAPNAPAMVSKYYGDPMMNFVKTNDIYGKGACVLHMLRVRLGDEVFWKGVRNYVQRYKLTCVETDDFRQCLEEASGQSLERFFYQWCMRPGLPRLEASIDWTPESSEKADGAGELRVLLKQVQRINADNPAYAISIPIYIETGGKSEYRYVNMDTQEAELVAKLTAKPTSVEVDPNLTVVAPTKIRKELTMWIEQLRHGSTLFARVQAAEHLREFDDARARAALASVGEDADEVLKSAAKSNGIASGR